MKSTEIRKSAEIPEILDSWNHIIVCAYSYIHVRANSYLVQFNSIEQIVNPALMLINLFPSIQHDSCSNYYISLHCSI